MPSIYIKPVLTDQEPQTARSEESNQDQTSQHAPSGGDPVPGEANDGEMEAPEAGQLPVSGFPEPFKTSMHSHFFIMNDINNWFL